ncbi:peptidyl-alpha-hydroxyglycine alpha-amidating lyase family protein [Streptomyces sp. NPDC055952]|uniref:peptidyl-alpha-hydroxyglycine alpha-amidating lyase family protein n=1 Tax=Streptomyces sp. NPDC055952 TaxID=3345663 RepID=UPI0035D821D2
MIEGSAAASGPSPRTPRGRRTAFSRRSVVVGVALGAVATTAAALRGDPPEPGVVKDGVPRPVRPADVLTPWGRLPATAQTGSGVAVSPGGDVFLLHRGGAPFAADAVLDVDAVVRLDAATGRTVGTWGSGLFKSPHGISTDAEGRVWVTDVMTNRVTVHRADGTLLKTIGHDYAAGLDTCLAVRNALQHLPCTGDPYIFARPTDVAVGPDGRAYVSDGYRNSRVARYAPDGSFLRQWGSRGAADGRFNIPHGITHLPDGTLAVADRRNARVQIFTAAGAHRATYASPQLGRPYDVATGPDGALYVLDGGDGLDEKGGQRRGYVVTIDRKGIVTRRWALTDQRADPHQLAVGPRGEIYVAALQGPPLWRWKPGGVGTGRRA